MKEIIYFAFVIIISILAVIAYKAISNHNYHSKNHRKMTLFYYKLALSVVLFWIVYFGILI